MTELTSNNIVSSSLFRYYPKYKRFTTTLSKLNGKCVTHCFIMSSKKTGWNAVFELLAPQITQPSMTDYYDLYTSTVHDVEYEARVYKK
jgi:hypothetical protein